MPTDDKVEGSSKEPQAVEPREFRENQVECPITLEVPRIPVITNDGHIYDFVSIAKYLLQESSGRSNPRLSPTTRVPINTLLYSPQLKDLTIKKSFLIL
jgi:hypothetical protein